MNYLPSIEKVKEITESGKYSIIGFGISTPEQAKKMAGISDGAIVGSAIIKLIEKSGADAAKAVGEYVKEMKAAISSL